MLQHLAHYGRISNSHKMGEEQSTANLSTSLVFSGSLPLFYLRPIDLNICSEL